MAIPSSGAEQSRKIHLVVLDVGGTIIEDHGDVVEAFRGSMARHGISLSPAEIAPWRGASKRTAIEHFIAQKSPQNDAKRKELAAKIYKDFVAQVTEAYKSVPPIAGAGEAIQKLRESGLLVAASTGFDHEIVNPIFRRLGWEKLFAAVITSDDVPEGRPAPYMIFHAMEAARVKSVAEVMAVGDTPLDLQAGANAGAGAVVGVLSGVGTAEQLAREPHTHIIQSVAKIPELL